MAINHFKETLRRLAIGFTVRDIMVPTESLTCALREKYAPTVSAEHPDFNTIPVIRKGRGITSCYDRDTGQVRVLEMRDLISEGTSILDVIKSLSKQPFCFILAHDRIAGYVHFSDLNNPLVKLSLYAILEELESHALAALGLTIDERSLQSQLSRKRFKTVKTKFDRAKAKEANRAIVDFLNIEDILRIASRYGNVHLNEQMIKAVTSVRNRVAHQVNPLVKNSKDVTQLALVVEECVRLLMQGRGGPQDE